MRSSSLHPEHGLASNVRALAVRFGEPAGATTMPPAGDMALARALLEQLVETDTTDTDRVYPYWLVKALAEGRTQ